MAGVIVEIPLTRGKVALIDEIDFPLVKGYSWQAKEDKRGCYARTTIPGTTQKVYMHRMIMGVCGCDHRDGNGLNNCRSNLRPATRYENARNKGKHKIGQSRFKGVNPVNYKGRVRWRAKILVGGRPLQLGYFASEIEAAAAYNVAAAEHYGEFARLNVLNLVQQPEVLPPQPAGDLQ